MGWGSGQSVCPVPQRSPIGLYAVAPESTLDTNRPAAVSEIKDPLKERSNASFEKHRVLLQALRLKKEMYPTEGNKKRCPRYQCRDRMWDTLGERRVSIKVYKGLVRGFGDETLRHWGSRLPRLVQNVPDKPVSSQKTKWSKMNLAGGQAAQCLSLLSDF